MNAIKWTIRLILRTSCNTQVKCLYNGWPANNPPPAKHRLCWPSAWCWCSPYSPPSLPSPSASSSSSSPASLPSLTENLRLPYQCWHTASPAGPLPHINPMWHCASSRNDVRLPSDVLIMPRPNNERKVSCLQPTQKILRYTSWIPEVSNAVVAGMKCVHLWKSDHGGRLSGIHHCLWLILQSFFLHIRPKNSI